MSTIKSRERPWFEYWFNSPYYHELYSNRDFEEAKNFINNIVHQLALKPDARVLDLACGKGRHTAQLASHGFRVSGIDLSEQNIVSARNQYPECKFIRADMRHALPATYDAIFNVFTSFGYFEDSNDNRKVIQNMCRALNPAGWLVLDYLNPEYVIQNLVTEEEVVRGDRTFQIHRSIQDDWVIKRIVFSDSGQKFRVEERVRLFSLDAFLNLLSPHPMKMVHTFGNYALEPFQSDVSERMIMLIQK